MGKISVVFSVLLFFSAQASWAAKEDLIFQSGPRQNTFIQLFTSDASPKANPALKWMSAQKDKDPKSVLWKTFVPITTHVSLWNTKDHKDAFAKKEFDAMLTTYRRKWNATEVYAPTMVVNGIEWSGWSRGGICSE